MKLISTVLIVIIGSYSTTIAQTTLPVSDKTEIYIVRHGEKAREGGDDPLLSDTGYKRAGYLMRYLKDKKIKRIYVTEFRRTQQTADSMRIQLGMDTVHYLADTACRNLFEAITKHEDWGKPILIVSHSNIMQKIVYKLGVIDFPQQNIPAWEFDNVFYIRYQNNVPIFRRYQYGAEWETIKDAPKMD